MKFLEQIGRLHILRGLCLDLWLFTFLKTHSFLRFTRTIVPPNQENRTYVYTHKMFARPFETQIVWFWKKTILKSDTHNAFRCTFSVFTSKTDVNSSVSQNHVNLWMSYLLFWYLWRNLTFKNNFKDYKLNQLFWVAV